MKLIIVLIIVVACDLQTAKAHGKRSGNAAPLQADASANIGQKLSQIDPPTVAQRWAFYNQCFTRRDTSAEPIRMKDSRYGSALDAAGADLRMDANANDNGPDRSQLREQWVEPRHRHSADQPSLENVKRTASTVAKSGDISAELMYHDSDGVADGLDGDESRQRFRELSPSVRQFLLEKSK